MRLWTVQPIKVYEMLLKEGVYRCTPSLSVHITDMDFSPAYDWLAGQMRSRTGDPPPGVKYPVWAWHTLSWEHKKPDLRRIEFRDYREPMVCLEIEIPDAEVLLSDEVDWHYVLNGWFLPRARNEAEYDAAKTWFDKLSDEDKYFAIRRSWERIFEVAPPNKNEGEWMGEYIQATFWELKRDQVKGVRYIKSSQ